MAYAMTKCGSQDNVITYEFICDTLTDMNAIENKYRTLGSIAIVLEGDSGGLEVYIANSSKQWTVLNANMNGSNAASGGLTLYICGQDEYNTTTKIPTVENPDETTLYLVPASEESGNLYNEYVYIDNAWELFGGGNIDLTGYAPISNPEFTGSISLNRKTGTTAGDDSIAVGYHTAANGDYSVAFGRDTIANGTSSFAGGEDTIAVGGQEFVIGGNNALPAAEWQANTAYAHNDYVIHDNKLYYCASPHTSAATFEQDSGWYHARKNLFTIGNGNNNNSRSNAYSIDLAGNGHYKGDVYVNCNADSTGGTKVAVTDNPVFTGSISLGRQANTTVGSGSFALGFGVTASGLYSHAEGGGTVASGSQSHAEGGGSQALGDSSHAEGSGTTSSGAVAHAEGSGNTASGYGSHAEGAGTTASGQMAHSEGAGTTASGTQSHAEGGGSIACGGSSHAEGGGTFAKNQNSHAEGSGAIANGSASHAEGNSTIATGAYEHVSGAYNVEDTAPTWVASTSYQVGDFVSRTETFTDGGGITRTRTVIYKCKTANSDSTFKSNKWTDAGQYLESIGNGTSDNARSNARALDWDGNEYLKGDIYVGCNADSTGGIKIPRIPAAPVSNGNYILKASVAGGIATYSWLEIIPDNAVAMADGTVVTDESGEIMGVDESTT